MKTFLILLCFFSLGGELMAYTLPKCPASPNCVNTQDSQELLALSYAQDDAKIKEKIIKVIKSFEEASVTRVEKTRVHAEFKSKVFGFIDDVIVYIDMQKKQLHFYSASRTGYYDFGVNKKRVLALQEALSD